MDALTIGNASVGVRPPVATCWSVDRLRQPFFVRDGSPVLELALSPLEAASTEIGDVRFDADRGWQVRETADGWSFVFSKNGLAGSRRLFRAITVDAGWHQGRLFDAAGAGKPRPRRMFPLGYPDEQLLLVSLLARSTGAVLHATGIVQDGQAWIFTGTHGAGKSTLARLFRGVDGVSLLNDDRVVLRRIDGRWRAWGTPWAGTVREVSAISAPVAGIFFIRHGTSTAAHDLSPAQAMPRLIARCFHPYWDRGGLEALLAAASQLAREVPCFDFPFEPRLRAVLSAVARALDA